MPASSTALWKPKLDITVDTIVLSFNLPRSFKYLPQMNIIWSPSTRLPSSSTAKQRSPSPSKATPTSAPVSFTRACNFSVCVEPTPSLMLIPSGEVAIVVKSVPKSANKRLTNGEVAPLAPSTATLIPDKSPEIVDTRNSKYLPTAPGLAITVPNPSADGRGNVSSSWSNNASISSS